MKRALSILAISVLLTGCGGRDVILQGTREAIGPDLSIASAAGAPLALPAARVNSAWTHRGGDARHDGGHPALGSGLSPVFVANLGAAQTRRNRITADPIVGGGMVFAMDSMAQVSALSPSGAVLWQRSVAPSSDGPREGAGGGLAYADGVVFVTTGYGRVMALDASSGSELWTQKLEAPGGAAPTVQGGIVYIAARNGLGWAVDADSGRVRYNVQSANLTPGISGGAGVAVTPDIAVFPFAGGHIQGVLPQGGTARWRTVLAGGAPGSALAAAFPDITGDPVIDGGRAYIGNAGGQVAALDLHTGDEIWSIPMAAKTTPIVEGNSVFIVNAANELVRLTRDGAVVWRVALPTYAARRWRNPNRLYAHYPVLAGGRILVASSDGMLRGFDPASGALVEQIELPAPAAALPAVAQGVLYITLANGQLVAYR